jgi:hypothetical protein
MDDFLRETVRYYPELDASMVRVVLVPRAGRRPSWASASAATPRRSCSSGVELARDAGHGYEEETVKVTPGTIGTMSLSGRLASRRPSP